MGQIPAWAAMARNSASVLEEDADSFLQNILLGTGRFKLKMRARLERYNLPTVRRQRL